MQEIIRLEQLCIGKKTDDHSFKYRLKANSDNMYNNTIFKSGLKTNVNSCERRQKRLPLADAFAIVLRDLGVKYIFGVSGANIENLHDAVLRLGEGKLVSRLCKSEIGASFMADGYSRFKGTIGVCCSTSGGGMMNLAVGVAEARASGVPLLAVVGCPPSFLAGQGAFQDASGNGLTVDAKMLWKSVSKSVFEINTANFWEQLFSSFSEALNDRPGPATLLIPRNLMEQIVPPMPSWWPVSLSEFRKETEITSSVLSSLISDINTADDALIIAGQEIKKPAELITFSDYSGIPVSTTLGATGMFPNKHPHFLGTIGVAGNPSTHQYLNESDLIIVVGSQLEGMIRAPFEKNLSNKAIYIINSNTDLSPKTFPVKKITASPEKVLKYFNNNPHLLIKKFNSKKLPERTYHKPQLYDETEGAASESENQVLRQSDALSVIQPFIPRNGNLILDAGNCAAAAAHYLKIPEGTRSLIALGMGGMGYAICAAIGIQLADPQKQTMVISGDGAFLVTGMEIHTAAEWQLPILWVFFNNSQHGMCTSRQKHFFNNRITCTQYEDVDIEKVVSGFGSSDKLWHGQATDISEMKRLLQDYYALQPRPGVLELKIKVEEIPPFFPLIMASTNPTK